jgi:NADPH:quinone reductase-like Zn-dependent oxidoreductase
MQTLNRIHMGIPPVTESPAASGVISMKAIVHRTYGSPDDLGHEDVAKPTLGDDDVLVRVETAAVCRGDVHVMTGTPYPLRLAGYGLRAPSNAVLGQELAGRVEAVGKNVTKLRAGDEVFGQIKAGAFAQYVRVSEDEVVRKPAGVSFEIAATLTCSALTALQGLRDAGQLAPGHKLLINGGSGAVGTFAVQIAKILGAEVTAVCSTRNVELLRSIGADRVIDYTQADFLAGDGRYDVFFDLVGNRSLSDCRRVLQPKGVYVASAGEGGGNWFGPMGRILRMLMLSLFVSQRMVSLLQRPNQADLVLLGEWAEAGKLAPVIRKRCTLSEIPDALRHHELGHAVGKTVVAV